MFYVSCSMMYIYMDQAKLDIFWADLSPGQQELITEGKYLAEDVLKEHKMSFKDYSFLIFPFAKTYEGYLKKLFLDVGFITHLDYISDHLRLGKLLSPNLIGRLGDRSLYQKITERASRQLAQKIWQSWKVGRNQVFHYFPHNYKAVSYEEAQVIINGLLEAMASAYSQLKLDPESQNHNKSQ